MQKIRLLDCTLRDGGYINNWNFKDKNIRYILNSLISAGTELIEMGFLRDCKYQNDRTLYNSVHELKKVLPEKKTKCGYILMALHDKYDIHKLEENDGTVQAIRVTFHNYDIQEGLVFGKEIMEKGYPLYVNPINIMGYNDHQLLSLLEKVNRIKPYGFSIVDTFGSMTKKELIRIYSLCENNLESDIVLGLHLHENMAQSFLLAQSFLEIKSQKRCCVLDASLNGMGRVPGNLCLELIMDYLNRNFGTNYDIDPVLDAIETCISPIKEKEPWGYMAEYFLSAKYNLHRNYAEYLLSKGSLTSRDMNCILKKIDEEKKSTYDELYIEQMYQAYENHVVQDEEDIMNMKKLFKGQNIVVLAPGCSLLYYWTKIEAYMKEKEAVCISLNFYFDKQKGGYAFFSNAKRYEDYEAFRTSDKQVIITSNITHNIQRTEHVIDYKHLSSDGDLTENCGILLLRLLAMMEVKEVALAGFDGYKEGRNNYMKDYFGEYHGAKDVDNKKIGRLIKMERRKIPIKFLTPSLYEEEI